MSEMVSLSFFPFSLPHSLFSLSITAFQSLGGVDKRRRQPGFSSESTLAGWDVTKNSRNCLGGSFSSPPLAFTRLSTECRVGRCRIPRSSDDGAVPARPRAVPSAGDRSKPAQHFMQKCLGIPVLGDVSMLFQMSKLGKSNNQKSHLAAV